MNRSLSSSRLDFEADAAAGHRLYEPLNQTQNQSQGSVDFVDDYENEELNRNLTYSDFQTPLTPFTRSPVQFFQERFKAGSMKGSVFILVVSIVGAGSLSVPYAVEKSGLVLGLGLFIIG
eukprot:CAMPEP_0204835406 /NCGR_PEP_ID=MMETSP1346-20131115/22569_1 /ASSEMBLY_ACC=CAM_ASM_000771 /TAXON_ID=215587 /ORGANISM="Aplanochytrium stocchinoi, Strain GSBS06" /LENGTH=119 /DNA_ID=CAMNT_0051969415 /DNA_START=282 /DNA_END=637 /DNA_ORIENTATION=-